MLVCLGAACWYKSINKIIGSNCTKASCCGMSIERKPLSEEAAIETQQKFAAIRSACGCHWQCTLNSPKPANVDLRLTDPYCAQYGSSRG